MVALLLYSILIIDRVQLSHYTRFQSYTNTNLDNFNTTVYEKLKYELARHISYVEDVLASKL